MITIQRGTGELEVRQHAASRGNRAPRYVPSGVACHVIADWDVVIHDVLADEAAHYVSHADVWSGARSVAATGSPRQHGADRHVRGGPHSMPPSTTASSSGTSATSANVRAAVTDYGHPWLHSSRGEAECPVSGHAALQ